MIHRDEEVNRERPRIGGIAGWILARLRNEKGRSRRLVVREQIALGQRQRLALVEADGRSFLVAIAANSTPSCIPLDRSRRQHNAVLSRVSW